MPPVESFLYGKKIIGTVAYMMGIPSVEKEFVWSAMQMQQYNSEFLCGEGEIINYIKPGFSAHSEARNWIADNMQGDWVLMLDCDHWFSGRLLARMLRLMYKYNLPILSGLYQFRHEPHPAVMFTDGETKENPFNLIDFTIKDFPRENELIKVASTGGGCLLIKKEVFQEIKNKLIERPFSHRPPFSEDHSFFLRCKELNIPVHVAPWIECHHIHHIKLKIEDHDNMDIAHLKKREVDIPTL